jgi:hypothetical protein
MQWNRQYLKYYIKDRRLMPREKEDQRLNDDRIHTAINEAMFEVAFRCGMLGELRTFPITANQYEYPMPDDINDIRRVWYKDASGNRLQMHYLPSSGILNGRDPDDDTSVQPSVYSYPYFQGPVLNFWAAAPNTDDYVAESWVTTGAIRTIKDSGINFGRELGGRRIKPGMIAVNLTDGSIGYVEVLDILTNKTDGTATSGTNTNTLEQTGKDFGALNVNVGDIICTPSTGVVTGYAFVTAVGTTTMTYGDFQSSGTAKRFESGDTYKVGVAQAIRLNEATPHPGLRDGVSNVFSVSATKATITGTTFTATTVTGSSTSGSESGDVAVASGGSHGAVSGVGDNELTVDKWIGGIPSAGEEVTVKECDKYRIQMDYRIERTMLIAPTPSTSDAAGSESIVVLCNTRPKFPEHDFDPIELPFQFLRPLEACALWKAAERAGDEESVVGTLEEKYERIVTRYQGDIYRPPIEEIMTAYGNRNHGSRARGRRYQDSRGIAWDITTL